MAVFRREARRYLVFPLFLLAVFIVANLVFNIQFLALGPETIPQVGEGLGFGEPIPLSGEALRTFFLSLLVAVLALIIITLLFFRRRAKGTFPLYELIGGLVAVLVVLAVMFIVDTSALAPPAGGGREAGTQENPEGPPLPVPADGGPPLGLGIVGGALAVILLGLFLVRRLARRRRGGSPPIDLRQRARARITEAIYALKWGEDVRSRILKCYAEMTDLFVDRGLKYGDDVTAREVEQLVRMELGLSSDSAERLRELFEEARYSAHMMSEGHRSLALRCLTSVKDDLSGMDPRGSA